MRIVVTCTAPESASKDGRRDEIWPIVGGRFTGKDIRGTVVPGGGDFPVTRPDGVTVIDALYRLKTDDGVTIIIHNRGLEYPGAMPADFRYRLAPGVHRPAGQVRLAQPSHVRRDARVPGTGIDAPGTQ